MIGINFITTTYLATNGKRYLSILSAAKACARKKLRDKYPTEQPEYEQGFMYLCGSDWTYIPNAEKVFRRLTKIYVKAYKSLLRTCK